MANDYEIERAEAHQDRLVQDRIQKQRSNVPVQVQGEQFCECGTEIPIKRRDLGFNTCIECAQEKARTDALYKR